MGFLGAQRKQKRRRIEGPSKRPAKSKLERGLRSQQTQARTSVAVSSGSRREGNQGTRQCFGFAQWTQMPLVLQIFAVGKLREPAESVVLLQDQ